VKAEAWRTSLETSESVRPGQLVHARRAATNAVNNASRPATNRLRCPRRSYGLEIMELLGHQ